MGMLNSFLQVDELIPIGAQIVYKDFTVCRDKALIGYIDIHVKNNL